MSSGYEFEDVRKRTKDGKMMMVRVIDALSEDFPP